MYTTGLCIRIFIPIHYIIHSPRARSIGDNGGSGVHNIKYIYIGVYIGTPSVAGVGLTPSSSPSLLCRVHGRKNKTHTCCCDGVNEICRRQLVLSDNAVHIILYIVRVFTI